MTAARTKTPLETITVEKLRAWHAAAAEKHPPGLVDTYCKDAIDMLIQALEERNALADAIAEAPECCLPVDACPGDEECYDCALAWARDNRAPLAVPLADVLKGAADG